MKIGPLVMTVMALSGCCGQMCGQDAAEGVVPVDSLVESLDVDEIPVVSRYFFVHQYLSVVAPDTSDDEVSAFSEPSFLNTLVPEYIGFRSPYKDSEINIEEFPLDDKTVYVWQFPEPKHLREALYVAFFPDGDGFKAVAISIGQSVDWEISTSNADLRHTYGRVKRPDSARECFDILVGRNAMHEKIDPGEFFQEGYECPDSDY